MLILERGLSENNQKPPVPLKVRLRMRSFFLIMSMLIIESMKPKPL